MLRSITLFLFFATFEDPVTLLTSTLRFSTARYSPAMLTNFYLSCWKPPLRSLRLESGHLESGVSRNVSLAFQETNPVQGMWMMILGSSCLKKQPQFIQKSSLCRRKLSRSILTMQFSVQLKTRSCFRKLNSSTIRSKFTRITAGSMNCS